MKQLLQYMRSGKTTVEEVPVPTPKPGTALIRTGASLVSAGTERMLVEFAEKSLMGKAASRPDLVQQMVDKARREGVMPTIEAAFNRLDQPMPLGYSSAGTIVAVGEGLQGYKVGQRVACGGGGYAVHAEYALVPQNLLTPLPDHVDFEEGAFATLGAIALHGYRLSEPQLGERVAIIGLGLLGLLTTGIAVAAGAHVIGIDLNPERVKLAESLGAFAVTRDQAEAAAQNFSRGRGVDAVLICADTTSDDPVILAGEIARDRAHVVATGAVGLNIPRKIYYEKELSFINSRSYGPGRYDPSYEEKGCDYPIGYVRWTEGRNLEAFVDLLGSGRFDVKKLISHRFDINQAPEAYDLITGKSQKSFLGVILTYPADGDVADPAFSRVDMKVEYASRTEQTAEIQLGILGAGNFAGAVMLPALKKCANVTLVGIASASGLNAQHAAKKFGIRYSASNAEQILHDPQINTVAVLTRHNLHARQIISALENGKHVFCEKPLAIHPEQLTEIEEALQADNGAHLLMVGFNRRFAPLAQKMKAFFADCKEPMAINYRINAGYLPLDHWLHDPESGGGRIVGEGCHFIDFVSYFVGSMPVRVYAQALPDFGRYQEDNVHMVFEFRDGSMATISYFSNGSKSFSKERIEVFQDGRVAVLDDFRSLEMIKAGKRTTENSRLRQDKGHLAEWEAFQAAISMGGPPPIPYDELFQVSRAGFAAVESLRNKQPVEIV